MFICEIMFGQRLDIQSTEIHPHRLLHSLHCKQTAIKCDTYSIIYSNKQAAVNRLNRHRQ